MGRHLADYMSLCALEGNKIFFTTNTARQLAPKDSVRPTCLKIRGCKRVNLCRTQGTKVKLRRSPPSLWHTGPLPAANKPVNYHGLICNHYGCFFFFFFLIASARSLQTEKGHRARELLLANSIWPCPALMLGQ